MDGSSVIDKSLGQVEDGVIAFPATITASQVLLIDPAAIEAEIRGKSLADAQAILDGYGQAELAVWPDWVGTIPTLDARVEVRMAEDGAVTGLLGIDLGERRIGIAIADGPDVGARPLVTLPRGRSIEADVASLTELIARHAIDELVVGLPLEAAGHEGPQAASTRAWVDALQGRLAERVAITLRDERLTSHLAESRLGPMPRGRSGGPPIEATARRTPCAGRP